MARAYAHFVLVFSTLLLLPFIGGCQSGASTGQTEQVKIGNSVYNLELATTDTLREHGLMERDTLAEDGGMIFAFPDSQVRKFWMHHTRFDLDILYLDPKGTVVSIKSMYARDETPVSSEFPAMFAIELHDGEAAKSGIKVGDHITLPAKAVASD